MLIISQATELQDFCRAIENSDYIAIDTEFFRGRRTYYPKCSLIQLNAGNNNLAVVDALKCEDLSPLRDILTRKSTVKIFHSCRQDVEVLYGLLKVDLMSLFDTQISSMFLGFTHTPGYDVLIAKYLSKTINKSLQFSNWLARPLSQEQLNYAASDVEYLYQVYEIIRNELEEAGYYQWVREECDDIVRRAKPSVKKITSKLLARGLGEKEAVIFKDLVQKREELAESLDINRSLVISDDRLIELSKEISTNKSSNKDAVMILTPAFTSFINLIAKSGAKGLSHRGSLARGFIDAVHGDYEYYVNLQPADIMKTYRKSIASMMEARNSSLYENLKETLQSISKNTGIALDILACRDDIASFIAKKANCRLRHGWRSELLRSKGIDTLNL